MANNTIFKNQCQIVCAGGLGNIGTTFNFCPEQVKFWFDEKGWSSVIIVSNQQSVIIVVDAAIIKYVLHIIEQMISLSFVSIASIA